MSKAAGCGLGLEASSGLPANKKGRSTILAPRPSCYMLGE